MLEFEFDMDAIADAVDRAMQASPERLEAAKAKARKALAVADDPNTAEAVRETANKKAAEILARYGWTAAMLADAGQIVDLPSQVDYEIQKPHVHDKMLLLSTLVRAYGGQLLYQGGQGKQSMTVHVFGMGSDLDRVKLLWPSLLAQLRNEFAAKQTPAGQRRDVFERSIMIGFRGEVGRRLDEAEKKTAADAESGQVDLGVPSGGRSMELVLADRKTQVSSLVKKVFPKTKSSRGRRLRLSAEGIAAGIEAGRRANLGTSNEVAGAAGRGAIG